MPSADSPSTSFPGRDRLLAFLVEVSDAVTAHVADLDTLLETVSGLIRKVIDYEILAFLLMDSGDALRIRYAIGLPETVVRTARIPLGHGITGTAAGSQKTIIVSDVSKDSRYINALAAVRSEMAVPLAARGRTVGVLDLQSTRLDAFSGYERQMVELIASRISLAIDNARLFEELARSQERLKDDLAAARRIQRDLLLPASPSFHGVEIAAQNRPVLEVSGDFYDFYTFEGTRLGIVVGDVSGKGVAAALYGALTSGLLRSLARFKQSPQELLAEVNRSLAERQADPATFATVGYVQWDPGTRVLAYASSGLPFPLIRRNGEVRPLPVEGIPLGMFRGTRYEAMSVPLEPGDLFVLASDGVLDSEDRGEQPYGEARLAGVIQACGGLPAAEIVARILQDLERHSAGACLDDDQTVVVLKVQ